MNGIETGLFEEYRPGDGVIWRGYYRNGQRYSEVIQSEKMKGYYEERKVDDNQLLSIAEYDEELRDKNGLCIEYRNGEVVGNWLYKKGMRLKPIQWNGGIVEEVETDDAIWMKTDNPMESPLLMESKASVILDIQRNYLYGVVKWKDKHYQVERDAYGYRIVEADVNGDCIRVFEGNKWKTIVQDDRGCLDLDTSGRRWEGGVKNGKPFGYGVLYDEEGRKEFEGFMMDGRRICDGREFYSDIDCLKYSGCYFNDRRYGYGILYDRKGNIDYEGIRDNNVSDVNNSNLIHSHVEHIAIPNQSFNKVEQLSLSHWFQSLKDVTIGDNCFQYVNRFVVDGLSELESIRIGEWSFSFSVKWNEIRDSTDNKNACRIRNCPKLKSICSGDYSFSGFHSLELENLPSLETLELGKKCCHAYRHSR